MTRRLLLLALVAGGVFWLARRSGPAAPAERASVDPCRDSLAWRVGEVDPRFPVSADRLEEAAAGAARLWNEAAGRSVLVHGADDGFPIDLVYDRRQIEAIRRRDARARIADLRAEVERQVARHRRIAREYESARDALERRAEALDRRISRHNETVRRRNEAGGAPPGEAVRLERTGRELDAEQRQLDRTAREVERQRREVNAQAELADRASERLEEATERYNRENSGRSVQAGGFEVRIETDVLGRLVDIDRSITIYHFEGPEDLSRVLAHELGHALGIEHVADPAALMHQRHEVGAADSPPDLRPADVAALRTLCAGETATWPAS